ncbi:uncharacterized protein LOC142945948 [Anarhichas minor]|uniref:uncharacterized protein LOC142945948 n=1 Tax=Anarhichas minor TaxID=65739 RepID=UPI003F734F2C
MFKLYVLLVPVFGAYGALLYAKPGHNVTLPCFYVSRANNLCWYKQVAGEQPQIISSFYKHSPDSNIFYNQFKDNKRFSVHTDAGFYHLNISNVQDSDSAMYYCGHISIAATDGYGALLYAKPGHNVTLPCFYVSRANNLCWYKQVAGEQPQIISSFYKHSPDSNIFYNQFKDNKRFSVHTDAGFYHLNISNVQDSDSAMYYCGHISIAATDGYGALLYAKPGHNVTLPCFYVSRANNLCWYKQVAGEQPQIISSFYKHSPDSNIFYNQFKDNKRFSVHTDAGFYHLNISNVQDSDSAMYYCGHISIAVTEFENGTFLVLKGTESSRRSFLQQPASDSVKPGGSGTLNCTVHTGTSDTEHSVYWFKKEDSRNSHLGIMYIHTHISSQCVQSLEPPAQSCVYSLSKTNVSRSDAGTYYCAVASCGEILFGSGTRLDVGENEFSLSLCCNSSFSVLCLRSRSRPACILVHVSVPPTAEHHRAFTSMKICIQ